MNRKWTKATTHRSRAARNRKQRQIKPRSKNQQQPENQENALSSVRESEGASLRVLPGWDQSRSLSTIFCFSRFRISISTIREMVFTVLHIYWEKFHLGGDGVGPLGRSQLITSYTHPTETYAHAHTHILGHIDKNERTER